jgi:hypothetical protein
MSHYFYFLVSVLTATQLRAQLDILRAVQKDKEAKSSRQLWAAKLVGELKEHLRWVEYECGLMYGFPVPEAAAHGAESKASNETVAVKTDESFVEFSEPSVSGDEWDNLWETDENGVEDDGEFLSDTLEMSDYEKDDGRILSMGVRIGDGEYELLGAVWGKIIL